MVVIIINVRWTVLRHRKANERNIWVWRSLVACLNGVQEAGSSNLLTQTLSKVPDALNRDVAG